MSLQNFASKIAAENSFIKASFGGFAGSGKTRTSAEFIIGFYKKTKLKAPLLIIDNEKGSRFLVPMFKNAGIDTYVKETVSLADVLEAFKMLQSGEVGFLFIDSLTKVWYQYVKDYRSVNRRTFMTLQDWGKILPAWQESFADVFVNTIGNIVFTGRGGYTYDMEENEETKKKEFVKSGVKMKMAGETPFEPDMNVWMEINQEMIDGRPVLSRIGLILKDRSGLIDGKEFKNPTFKDFEPVIDYLLNVDKGEIKKESDKTNLAPAENFESQNRRDRKEIELEKIINAMVKSGLGTSNDDKKLKIQITEKFFNTTAWSEVEKMPVERLTIAREKIEEMFQSWELLIDYSSKTKFIADFKLNDINL